MERLRRGRADGTRLMAAQAFQIIFGRRRSLAIGRRKPGQAVLRRPLFGDDDFTLLLDQFLDLRKAIAQIADRRGGGHGVETMTCSHHAVAWLERLAPGALFVLSRSSSASGTDTSGGSAPGMAR